MVNWTSFRDAKAFYDGYVWIPQRQCGGRILGLDTVPHRDDFIRWVFLNMFIECNWNHHSRQIRNEGMIFLPITLINRHHHHIYHIDLNWFNGLIFLRGHQGGELSLLVKLLCCRKTVVTCPLGWPLNISSLDSLAKWGGANTYIVGR